jgi:hypothetical protein
VDRGEILQRVVAHLAVQRQVGRHRALRAVYPRVAVGRRAGRHFRADHAARTGAVSTTTDCFNVSDIFLAMVRDAVSVMPPGVNGTIQVIGLLGNLSCANESAGASASVASSDRSRTRKLLFMIVSFWLYIPIYRRTIQPIAEKTNTKSPGPGKRPCG